MKAVSIRSTKRLVDDQVYSMVQDREGYLWFVTGGGVSRYDPRIETPSTESILSTSASLGTDSVGGLGTDSTGQSAFRSFTVEDGLVHNQVFSLIEDQEGYREGRIWFGAKGGVSRYDASAPSEDTGRALTTFKTNDGLPHPWVYAILQDREGYVWFGTHGGAGRYDGQEFITFNNEDGLPSERVWSICQTHEGYLWFGTRGGVSQYDGRTLTTFIQEDGLADDGTNTILSG